MRPVVQEEATGCAIACVATIAGVCYEKARVVAADLGIYTSDETLWSDTAHVRRLLDAFGFATASEEVAFRAWESLPDLCLLAIKWRMKASQAFWHWVVFYRSPETGPVVLDPKRSLKTNVRRDFGRVKPRWYIPVSKNR